MLALSRPPLSSSPLPSRTNEPSPSERATSASACAFTIAARSLASSPSGNSGKEAKAMSVTTRPRTESPRNSSRSLVVSRPCSNAYERCVSAVTLRPSSTKRMPKAASRASGPGCDDVSVWVTPSLDLDGLPARVVPAVRAHAVGKLRLMTLWALRVRGLFRFPVRGALVTPRLALLLLGDCHLFIPSYVLAQVRVRVLASLTPCRSLLRRPLRALAVGLAGVGLRAMQGFEQLAETCPARVDVGLRARALAAVQVAAAAGAQTPAIGTAHRGERQLDTDQVADHLIGIEEALRFQRVLIGVLVRERREQLANLDGELL